MASNTSFTNQLTSVRQPWWLAGIIAAVTAAIANAIVYGIARAADTIPQDVLVTTPSGEEPIGLGSVILASIVPILLAAVLYVVLQRFTEQPVRLLWIIATVVLAFSLIPLFTLEDVPAKMVATLLAMHIIAAVVGIGTFTRLVQR